MKYKQKVIPSVNTPVEWKGKKISQLRALALEKTRSLYSDAEVTNEHLNICIHIKTNGLRKSSYGEAMYYKKAVTLLILPEILQYARYNNFGSRKDNDPTQVVGYLNFVCKCKIDGLLENLRIAVQFRTDGKFYYNVEVNKVKKK